MSAHEAFVHCLEPVPGATRRVGTGALAPDWDRLLDDRWLARLSDGERALVHAGLQLYNGGSIKQPPSFKHMLCAVDDDNRHRLLHAIGMAFDEMVTVVSRATSMI